MKPAVLYICFHQFIIMCVLYVHINFELEFPSSRLALLICQCNNPHAYMQLMPGRKIHRTGESAVIVLISLACTLSLEKLVESEQSIVCVWKRSAQISSTP